ncbi:MAG: YitT family protein, partial [Lachnospiraceae bacterium]
YGMIINAIFAIAVDKVMYGINAGKMALIITTKGEAITQVIEECCQRGSTILNALGGYRQDAKEVVLCACNNKQMYQVEKAIKEVDPDSFLIILESNEVIGEGFQIRDLAK